MTGASASETRRAGFARRIEPATESVVLVLAGELDLACADGLRDALRRAERMGGTVALDLSDVEFIDVVCTGVIIEASERLRAHGRPPLRVVAAGDEVRRLLRLMQADALLAPRAA